MKTRIFAIVLAVLLTGCATQKASLSLNRTLPERMTDIGIERQVMGGLNQVAGLTQTSQHRIAVDAFRGELLLTGEVPDGATKMAVENMARSIKEVKKVHNYLKINDKPKSQSHTVHENYLKTKFLSKLLATRSGIKSSQYHAIVRDDLVYMMGMMTVNQSNLARQVASETEGVAGFVSLMTVLAATQQELLEQYQMPQTTTAQTLPATSTPPAFTMPSQGTQGQGVQGTQRQGQSQTSSYINLYQNTNTP